MKRAALILLFTCGCGPQAGIWLTVQAPYAVPTACDGLTVSATRTTDGAQILQTQFALNAQDPFPVTLSLTTSNGADVGVQVVVAAQASLQGTALSQTSQAVQLDSRTLVPLTLSLGQPTP